ncbi:hypothetical protein Dimus_004118 [Dionaea muscipula]
MARKKAMLLTINGLTSLPKVVSSPYSFRSLKSPTLVNNLSTAIERSDFAVPNNINYEYPIDCPRELGGVYGEGQNRLGFSWKNSVNVVNYQKNGDVGRNFGAIRGNEYEQKPRRSEGREYRSFQNDWNGNRPIWSNQTRHHDYQQGKIGGFESGRNENYLESGAQYQAISSDNVNGNARRFGQLSNESENTPIDLQAPVGSRTDGEPGKHDLFEGTLEELDKVCEESNMKDAVQILRLLEEKGIVVNLPRYLLLLKACAKAKALVEAKAVHEHLVKSESLLDISTGNVILEMYAKCGSMQDAYDVFCSMPECNLTSWDIMITWLAKNGLGEDAIDMFSQFRESGLKPDGQMFIGVFTACGALGDVTEGMLHFDSMSKVYGIVPTMDHYVGIVDMLGTCGYLDEALDFIEKMPMEPSFEVWETLMNLCRIQGNMELGNRCSEIVEELNPSHLSKESKVGLVPVTASVTAPKEETKKAGSESLLEIKSKVHEFRAGDRSSPDTDRIYELLKGLKEQMKEEGYVPETRFVLHDIHPEEKEEAIMSHSERLAAASSLLKTPTRHEVRIIKNLRVCVDCHSAFKIISKIVGRKFIMRDAKRFHHMEDGKCSCNDYWYRGRRSRSRSISPSPPYRRRKYSRSPFCNPSRGSPAKQASNDRSRSSTSSPPGKKGLVSYGDGSPDSGKRKNVVFGKLVQGHEVLQKIEDAGDEEGRPAVTVKITNCGVWNKRERKRSSKVKSMKDAFADATNSSSDSELDSSEFDTDSESGSSSLSDTTSSSDVRHRKRKMSSRRDKYKRGKRQHRRREKKHRRHDKRTQIKKEVTADMEKRPSLCSGIAFSWSMLSSDTLTVTDSEASESSSEDGEDDVQKSKDDLLITDGNHLSLVEENELLITTINEVRRLISLGKCLLNLQMKTESSSTVDMQEVTEL